jgi:hypothetical protein
VLHDSWPWRRPGLQEAGLGKGPGEGPRWPPLRGRVGTHLAVGAVWGWRTSRAQVMAIFPSNRSLSSTHHSSAPCTPPPPLLPTARALAAVPSEPAGGLYGTNKDSANKSFLLNLQLSLSRLTQLVVARPGTPKTDPTTFCVLPARPLPPSHSLQQLHLLRCAQGLGMAVLHAAPMKALSRGGGRPSSGTQTWSSLAVGAPAQISVSAAAAT